MAEHEHEDKKSHGHGGGGHGGGGGHEEAHEGAPEWLISFADNTALMMGFFVIMLALTMKQLATTVAAGGTDGPPGEIAAAHSEQGAMLDWAIAVREGFNNPVDINSNNPADAALVQRLRERLGRGKARDPGQKGQHDEVQSIRPSDYVGAGGVVLFADGADTIDAGGLRGLAQIATRLRGRGSLVEVRGHTSAAESYRAADQGFDLSYRRSQAVTAELTKLGIEMRRVRLVAAASNQRATTPEYDEAAQQNNRRVEVVELPDRAEGVDEKPFGSEPQDAADDPAPRTGDKPR